MASSSDREAADNGNDDGGFGRYRNGRHQRQMQQRVSKQTQRASYADPLSDGTLRGFANRDYHRSNDSCQSPGQQNQRPHELPVFTVSGAKVAFNSPAPGESSTDAWKHQQDEQDGSGCCSQCSGRSRLIAGLAILVLAVAAIILVIALPVTLVANRRLEDGRGGGQTTGARLEASGDLREIACGVLRASSQTAGSGGGSVYRFRGIPYALPPNGTRLLTWARSITSQEACAIAWSLTPAEAAAPWFQRQLRYPHPEGAPMCLQYSGMGAPVAPAAAPMSGSADCLYLDVATPSTVPGRNLPTVVVLASLLGIYSPASLLLDVPDGLVASTGCVFVSVRHRVGPLAYLTHRDLSDESSLRVGGNLPISDLVTALRWLRVNVRGFGGSPDNVVLMGTGTSASMALTLALTGQYSSLFHKLWISSPPLNVEQFLSAAMDMDEKLVPCLKSTCRQTLNVSSLVASVGWSRLNSDLQSDFFDIPALAPVGSGSVNSRRGFSVIDGIHVPDSLIRLAAAGRTLTKPLVLGSMLEDSALYFIDPVTHHWTQEYLLQYIDHRMSTAGINGTGTGAQARQWYQSLGYWNSTSPNVLQQYSQVVTDLRLTCALAEFSRRLAAASASSSAAAPFYRFLMSARPSKPLAPYEWSQFAYTAAFGGYDTMLLYGSGGVDSVSATASWRAAFAEFARTGGVASWQKFEATAQLVNLVSDQPWAVQATANPRGDVCELWAGKFPNLLYRGWYS